MIPASSLDFSALVALWDRLAADMVLGGIGSELERVTEYVASQAPAVVPHALGSYPGFTERVGGGGSITNDQFVALARCESGTFDDGVNTGGYRTGLYGIEGPGSGSMSPADQRAWAQQIFNDHGASAWGVLCRGILGG